MNHVSSQLINFSLSPANRFISLSLVLILLVLSSIYVRLYINYTDHSQIPVRLSAIKSWIAPNFLPTNEAKSEVILKCHTHPDSSHKKGAKVLMTFLYLWYLSFCILFYISGAFCKCSTYLCTISFSKTDTKARHRRTGSQNVHMDKNQNRKTTSCDRAGWFLCTILAKSYNK